MFRFELLAIMFFALTPGVQAVEWKTPPHLLAASGPAFPKDYRPGNPPDPAYGPEKAIDGDPESFACLLDDTLTGEGEKTIPIGGSRPVTGHLVFDLGEPRLVLGARLVARPGSAAYNPQNVDYFYFADDSPDKHKRVDDIENDTGIVGLVMSHETPALSGDSLQDTVFWDAAVARYVGIRVNSSYESRGPVHYNFQIGELQFLVGDTSADLKPGMRIPPLYEQQATPAETLLHARRRYHRWFGNGWPAASKKVWQKAREDFAQWAFFDEIRYDWFEEGGWLDSHHATHFEDRFLQRLLDRLGSAGNKPREEYEFPRQEKAHGDDLRWLSLCCRTAELAKALEGIQSARAAVEELAASYPDRYEAAPFLAELGRIEDAHQLRFERGARPEDEQGQALAASLEATRREALVEANPLLACGKIVFAKRKTYSPGWYYADFMYARHFGGNLCVLDLNSGRVTDVVPSMSEGIFDRFDLSFDATRLVFGYKGDRGEGMRIFEVGVDGSKLRQLTFPPEDEAERVARYRHPRYAQNKLYAHHTDDLHPCYLPDGGICFSSTRCERSVLCGEDDSLAVNTLYRMDADGSNLRMLSRNALSEHAPSVMADGRILYTRWEYVDKGVIAVQSLWSMRPDGSGSAEIYGNDIENPPVLIHGRQIPGDANLFVATVTMHHPLAVGPITLIDITQPVDTLEPLTSVTPECRVNVDGVGGFGTAENWTHQRNGRWVKDNRGPLFADPFPLADPETGVSSGKFFLVSCNPDQNWNHPTAYGIWLIDTFGNRVRIYDAPHSSCWTPIPLQPRSRRPVITPVREENSDKEATVVLSDVYQGLDGIPRGNVKYLRVLEQVPRPWSSRRFWPDDTAFGQHVPITWYSHIFVKVHHGVVPVEDDGSAHFRVPADRNIFFQALDEDFMEIQRMRTFVDFQAGETRSCIGCHEGRAQAPPQKPIAALSHAARDLQPQPGETVPRPIHYPSDVQPVWDRHCTGCHGSESPDGGLNLTGDMTTFFNRSYEELMSKGYVAYIQEFRGPQPRAQKTNVVPLPPKALGSHASRVMQVLREGHYGVELDAAELARVATWLDSNGQYYGSYFGPRNQKYRNRADFRPTPTIQSACGNIPDLCQPFAR